MSGRFGRFLFAFASMAQSPLMTAPSVRDADTGDALPGVRGRLYESPHAGWTMVFDPERWSPESATSTGDIDTLTLVSRNPQTASARVIFRTSPGTASDLASSLNAAEAEILALYPNSTVKRMPIVDVEPSGKWLDDHWVATYLVTDSDAPGGSASVDVDCWPVHGTDSVLTVTAISTQAEYDTAYGDADALRASYRQPGARRTGGRKTKQSASGEDLSGVLEFRQLYEGSGHLGLDPEEVDALNVKYEPPQMDIPTGKDPVLFTGLVGNVDIAPAQLDLKRFVARFPVKENVPGDHVFTPVAHQWLLGFPPESSSQVSLQPGQGAAYLVWFLIDIVPENESLSVDARYEPGDGTATVVGRSSRRGYYYPIAGGGAGGSRPKVQY